MSERRICFLDQDGVLTDFHIAAHAVHQRSWVYVEARAKGNYDLAGLFGLTSAQFWGPIDELGADFWGLMSKMPDADAIVALCVEKFGPENIAVLTSPHQNSACFIGKLQWLEKNYPWLAARLIFADASTKKFLAGPGRIIIEDREDTVNEFNQAGGTGILIPRLWNSQWRSAHKAVDMLTAALDLWA
jgi:hypothetical protein